jgi:hypothetical protein
MKCLVCLCTLYHLFAALAVAAGPNRRKRPSLLGFIGNHCCSPATRNKQKRHLYMSSSEHALQTASWFLTKKSRPREVSREITNTKLYPPSEHNHRLNVGRDAQFGNEGGAVLASSVGSMDANDPRLSLTYHEFPLNSMDELISLASQEFQKENGREPDRTG